LHIVVSTVLRHVLPDTKQLLQLSKMVDQTRISSLLIRHRYAIYGYIFACLRNHADAEDVFQEVSVVTVSSHAQLLDEDGFLPWAREIARRLTLTFIRKKQRLVQADQQLVELLAKC